MVNTTQPSATALTSSYLVHLVGIEDVILMVTPKFRNSFFPVFRHWIILNKVHVENNPVSLLETPFSRYYIPKQK